MNQNSTTGQTTTYLSTNPNNNLNKAGKPAPLVKEKSNRSLMNKQTSETKTEEAEQNSRVSRRPREEQGPDQKSSTRITKTIIGTNPTVRIYVCSNNCKNSYEGHQPLKVEINRELRVQNKLSSLQLITVTVSKYRNSLFWLFNCI